MEIIKATAANHFIASPSTTILEYMPTDETISGAVADIRGRYPEQGLAQ